MKKYNPRWFCGVGKKKARLIHYGSRTYDFKEFDYIKNAGWCKPKGGLWTSPVNSQFGWRDWCQAEEFNNCIKENSFVLKVKPWAKILKIDSLEDLETKFVFTNREALLSTGERLSTRKNDLLSEFYQRKEIPDFEYMRKKMKVDMIWLTEEGQWKTRLTHPLNLYGWDCETVLILNFNSVEQVFESVDLEDVVLEKTNEERMKEWEQTGTFTRK